MAEQEQYIKDTVPSEPIFSTDSSIKYEEKPIFTDPENIDFLKKRVKELEVSQTTGIYAAGTFTQTGGVTGDRVITVGFKAALFEVMAFSNGSDVGWSSGSGNLDAQYCIHRYLAGGSWTAESVDGKILTVSLNGVTKGVAAITAISNTTVTLNFTTNSASTIVVWRAYK